MTFDIIPFKKEHLLEIDLRPMDKSIFDLYKLDDFIPYEQGLAVSYIKDGELLGSGGVIPIQDGIGISWMTASGNYKKYPIITARTMFKIVNRAFKELNLKVIRGTCNKAHKEAIKWHLWAGYKQLGLLENFGSDGSDHLVFERLNNVI